MSSLWYIHFLVYLAVQLVGAQQITASSNPQPSLDRAILSLLSSEQQNSNNRAQNEQQGERVDKLASAMGDLYWRNQQQQQQAPMGEWLYQLPSAGRMQRSLALSEADFQGEPADSQAAALIGLDGPNSGSRNYHALVDEFKQYSRLANPSRESRAFKPKLMSTARGFGKRSQQPQQMGELGASSNGKMG